jgi:hypothetical protein
MALVEPRRLSFSEVTQEQMNRLPQYHVGRRLRTSNWAGLFNALDGVVLEDYKVQERRALRNLFLRTVHLDEPDLLRVVDLPPGTNLEPPQVNVNLLRNGSFELRSRPDRVADFWTHSGVVEVQSVALFGATSPALTPASGATSRISQIVKQDAWNGGESRTFSAWYRINTWAGGTIPSSSHGLLVTVTYGTGATQTFRAAFAAHTSDQWRRVTLTVTPTVAVVSYEVKLETARSASFNLTVPVRLDAVQAEANSTATVWQPNLFDSPNWFFQRVLTPVHFDGPVPIFVTDTLRDFYYEAIPTRVELLEVRDLRSDADRRGGFGEALDFHHLRWAFTWDVDPAVNKIRRIGLDPQDIYGSFDLSLFTGTEDGERFEEGAAGLTYRCATQFQRWLWVVHQTRDLNGNTIMALSMADPRVPFPSPTHYEAKMTLPLPLSPGDYHRVEFQFEDPQHLYISTPITEYVLRLYYDYAIINTRTLQTFFREKYASLALVR